MPGPSTVRQLLSIPFAKGLSQHEAPEYLAPGAAIVAQNAIHPKVNRLAKRPGLTVMATLGIFPASGVTASVAATLSSGKRLGNFNGALTVIGQDSLTDAVWAYDDQAAKPVLLDRMPEVYCDPPEFVGGVAAPVTSTLVRANQPDQCILLGYEVTTWSVAKDTGGGLGNLIYYSVRDAATSTVVETTQLLLGAPPDATVSDVPKLIAVGNFAVVCFATSGGNIYAMTKDMSAAGNPWLAPVRVNNTLNDAGLIPGSAISTDYDIASSLGETTKFALVYISKVGAAKAIVLSRIDVTGGVVTIAATAGGTEATWTADAKPAATFALRADFINGELALLMSWTPVATPRVSIALYSWPAMALTATAVDLYGGAIGPLAASGAASASHLALERIGTVGGKVAYKAIFSASGGRWENAGVSYPYIASYIAQNNAGTMIVGANTPRVTWGITAWSRIVVANGQGYIVGYVPSMEQGSFFLLADDAWADITTANAGGTYFPMRLVANLSVRQSSVFSSTIEGQFALDSRVQTHCPPNSFAAGGNVFQTPFVRDVGPTMCAPAVTRCDFASAKAYQNVQIGQNTLYAGGCPTCFDGSQAFGVGMPVYPILAQTVTGGAGTFAAGTYLFIAVFQWVDARGQLHESARSLAISVTTILNDSVSIAIGTCGFDARAKSQCVPASGPQAHLPSRRSPQVVLYRTAAGGSTFYQDGPPVSVVLSSPIITIVDAGLSDLTLTTHPQLYGDGTNGNPGFLDEQCPPACQSLVVHQNRAFFLDGSNVWPSRVFTANEGVSVNDSTAFSVDDGAGPLTGGASMDGNLILFKADRLFVMTGQGPNDSGGANDWQPPERIASDCGCIDWRSIVVTPEGTRFQSRQGMRLLTRDLQVTRVVVVEGELATYPFPTSAVLHPTQNRMLLTVAGQTTGISGEILDHDYVIDSWTTSKRAGGSGFVSAAVAQRSPAKDSAAYYVLSGSGQVLIESTFDSFDASTFVPMQFETPWIHAEGIEGFARFRRLMVTWQSADPHQLLVYVAYDMAPFGDAPTYYLLGTVTATQMAAMTTPMCEAAFQLPRHRAQAVRFKVVDAADGTVPAVTGAGPVLVSLGLEVAIYQQKRFGRVSAAQRS